MCRVPHQPPALVYLQLDSDVTRHVSLQVLRTGLLVGGCFGFLICARVLMLRAAVSVQHNLSAAKMAMTQLILLLVSPMP